MGLPSRQFIVLSKQNEIVLGGKGEAEKPAGGRICVAETSLRGRGSKSNQHFGS